MKALNKKTAHRYAPVQTASIIINVLSRSKRFPLDKKEALRIKEKFGGEVTVVGLGPKRVTESIPTALAMGADKGILISDEALEGGDPLSVAKVLAAAIKELDYDLILTGQRSVDEYMGVVGANIAELLDIPQLSVIDKIEVAEHRKSVKVNRLIE